MTDLTHFQHYGLWSPPSARLHFVPRETMRDIIERVAHKRGVDIQALIGPSRRKPLVLFRHEAMWEVWRRDRWTLKQIGRAFGNRDHTSILHAVEAHERRVGVEAVAAQAEIAA